MLLCMATTEAIYYSFLASKPKYHTQTLGNDQISILHQGTRYGDLYLFMFKLLDVLFACGLMVGV